VKVADRKKGRGLLGAAHKHSSTCPLFCPWTDQSSTTVEHLWRAYYRYARLGERSDAIRTLRTIVARAPDNIEALVTLGDELAQAGDYAAAIAIYESLLARDPKNRRVRLAKAQATAHAGDSKRALSLLNQLVKDHSTDVEILMTQGQLEAHVGEFAAAERSFTDAIAHSGSPTPHLLVSLGIARSGLGKEREAINAFHRALQLELAEAANRWGLTQHLQSFLLDAGLEAGVGGANAAPIAPVVIATLPKSATMHIEGVLHQALGLNSIQYSTGGYFPNMLIGQHALQRAIDKRGFLIGHYAATPANIALIRHYTDRMVLHLRDPRQALLSYAHFLPTVLRDLDPAYYAVYRIPSDYLSMPFPRQLDWLIENYMPLQIDWINRWTRAIESGAGGLRVKVTTYEQFRVDPLAFYEDLLSFYGRSDALSRITLRATAGERNYRAGETDEWRTVLSQHQARSATERIPQRLLKRFGWIA